MQETHNTSEILKNYLDIIPVGLLVFNPNKEIISWNTEILKLLEIANEDLEKNSLGKTATQIQDFLRDETTSEKELFGLQKQYKLKKIVASDKNIILIITESFQESIGEMSHELRRPLTNIKTLCESLLMGAKDDPDVAHKFLENMNQEIDRLTRLVNDLLNISKIRSGRVEITKRKINLKEKSEDAIKLLKPIADKKHTKLINNVIEGFTIFADEEQIDHVIQNLIENAIKYSPEHSTVTIKAGPIPGSFQIDDTGIGIEENQISKIFERFYRIDKTKAKGSSGLGLSIVKNIIDIHNGKIEVKSTIGAGSSFIVYLPID